jgi:hypothetical protein
VEFSDFEAPPTVAGAMVLTDQGGGIHAADSDEATMALVNRTGHTQFRLRFEIDDDENGGNDFIGFFSGDASNSSQRPRLLITLASGPLQLSFNSDPIVKSNAKANLPYNDSIAADATDPENDPLTFSKIGGPAWLDVALDGALSGFPGVLDQGLNSFTVEVTDGLDTDQATLNIFVDPPNQPPFFNADPFGKPNATVDVAYNQSIALDATDPDGDPITFTKISGPAWLNIALDGTLTGLPGALDEGFNSFTVEVSDGIDTDQAFLDIVVDPNQPPAFNSDPFSKPNVIANLAYSESIALDATDPEGDPMTFSMAGGGPAWLAVAPDGALTGTPGDLDAGLNSFIVEVSDGHGTGLATLEIMVDPNQPPVFNSDPFSKPNATVNLAFNQSIALDATDPEGDPMTFSKIGGPAWLNVASDGSLTGMPGGGDAGLNSFTVQVNAGSGMGQATLNITVDPGGQAIFTLTGVPGENGRIRESSENSGLGGGALAGGAIGTAMRVGDTTVDRQYLAILSFDTSSIPDSVTIQSARLELTLGGSAGTITHGPLTVDIIGGTFGASAIENADFQTVPGAAGVATLSDQGGSIHAGNFSGAALAHINTAGRTQFKIRYLLDDDENGTDDWLGFFSAGGSNSSVHPRLIVTAIE